MAQKQDLQPLLDVRQNQLNFIFSSSDSLDTKNLAMLAINVAVLIFVAQLEPQSGLITTAVFACFIVSSVLNILSILPRTYIGASVDVAKHPEYLSMAEDDLVLQLIADTQLAITNNSGLNTGKIRLCIASIAFSAIGTGLLVWGIL